MSLAFLFPYFMLNMFRMLIHPSSGACYLFVELFHGQYCSGSMCVGVTLWFGWGSEVSGCRLQPASGYLTNHQTSNINTCVNIYFPILPLRSLDGKSVLHSRYPVALNEPITRSNTVFSRTVTDEVDLQNLVKWQRAEQNRTERDMYSNICCYCMPCNFFCQ